MSLHVLIVEDERELMKLWRYALEQRGHIVMPAYDGVNAIQILRENPPLDVIVVDYHLPFLNGAKVLDALNRIWPNHSVTRVMITANPWIDQKNYSDLVDQFLLKPTSLSDLVKAVERQPHTQF